MRVITGNGLPQLFFFYIFFLKLLTDTYISFACCGFSGSFGARNLAALHL